jgi:hypothetical protein
MKTFFPTSEMHQRNVMKKMLRFHTLLLGIIIAHNANAVFYVTEDTTSIASIESTSKSIPIEKMDVLQSDKKLSQENNPIISQFSFVRQIVAISQNKTIRPEEAITLLSQFMAGSKFVIPQSGNALQQQITSQTTENTTPFTTLPISTPYWVLSKEKTLKENLEEWTKLAGWSEPVWKSHHNYQINFSSTVHGSLIDAIGQIAQSIPDIDFHVWKKQGLLQVSDKHKQ